MLVRQFQSQSYTTENSFVERSSTLIGASDIRRLQSQQRTAAAQEAGKFSDEIFALQTKMNVMNKETKEVTEQEVTVDKDECNRPSTTLEDLAALNPINGPDKFITAGNASQITDGAAAVMVCNDAGLKKIKASPRAEIVSISVVGDDPVFMLTGPIPASFKALESANLSIEDIDLYEVNEAFAPVPLAWAADLKADRSKLNVNGGAMALGHPLGATGAAAS